MEEDNQISRRTLWLLLTGVFLISFSLLAFEITLTRLLSVVLSYHYVFAVVSLALLGLGTGGIFPSLFSLSIPFSVILITRIAYLENLQDNVLLYGPLLFIPFFLIGVFLAEVFRTFPALSSRIYGADLIGAAAGSLGVILILNSLGGINSIFLLALVASMLKNKSPCLKLPVTV